MGTEEKMALLLGKGGEGMVNEVMVEVDRCTVVS